MTKTEELLVALMEFDAEAIARFVKMLSYEDLAKFELGLGLARTLAFMEEDSRPCDSNSTRLNRESIKSLLEDRMYKIQSRLARGA